MKRNIEIHLICGPRCGGKTSYAKTRKDGTVISAADLQSSVTADLGAAFDEHWLDYIISQIRVNLDETKFYIDGADVPENVATDLSTTIAINTLGYYLHDTFQGAALYADILAAPPIYCLYNYYLRTRKILPINDFKFAIDPAALFDYIKPLHINPDEAIDTVYFPADAREKSVAFNQYIADYFARINDIKRQVELAYERKLNNNNVQVAAALLNKDYALSRKTVFLVLDGAPFGLPPQNYILPDAKDKVHTKTNKLDGCPYSIIVEDDIFPTFRKIGAFIHKIHNPTQFDYRIICISRASAPITDAQIQKFANNLGIKNINIKFIKISIQEEDQNADAQKI